MAIYHITAKTVSRGTASAKARYEYIEREGRYASDKNEVSHSQSGNMPEWARQDAKKYWDSADTFERGNGRLFKQIEFALPRELNADQQRELAQEFVSRITTTNDGPLPYSYAIHKGHDKENPHCHLMISERANDGHSRSPETWFKRANGKAPEKGGAKKSEELKPKEWLQDTRQGWSLEANRALERAGHSARIDHRTLQAQGIDREATTHRGVAVCAMEQKGRHTERGEAAALVEKRIHMARELGEAKAELAQIGAQEAAREREWVERRGRLRQEENEARKAAEANFAQVKKYSGENALIEARKAYEEKPFWLRPLINKEQFIQDKYSYNQMVAINCRNQGEAFQRNAEDLAERGFNIALEYPQARDQGDLKAIAEMEAKDREKQRQAQQRQEEARQRADREQRENAGYKGELNRLAKMANPNVVESVLDAWKKPYLDMIQRNNEDKSVINWCISRANYDASPQGQAEIKAISKTLEGRLSETGWSLSKKWSVVRSKVDKIRVAKDRQEAVKHAAQELQQEAAQELSRGRGR